VSLRRDIKYATRCVFTADSGASSSTERRPDLISGQRGYKLTIEATLEEISSTSWLKSQGKKMIRRWVAIQRVAHSILVGAKS
jgi:hypothetical protein